MELNMMSASAFAEPTRIVEPLNWVGHVPFAMWITEMLKPGMVAELGTHTGNSYFAFCQSVRDHGLPTHCYAVDTWQGDEHAGYYGDEIYNTVATYNDEHYLSFSRLLRMTFDEALSRFSDGSIDLLHIDGLHTYEAVRHDFECWLPKMSDRGVILFHDTTVKHADFGVWRLWDEVSKKYPHIAFDHSHGLGVLVTGTKIEPAFAAILRDFKTKMGQARIKTLFANLGDQLVERYREPSAELPHNFGRSFPDRKDDSSNTKGGSGGSNMPKPIHKLGKSIKKRYGKLKTAFNCFNGKEQTSAQSPQNDDEKYHCWIERFDCVDEDALRSVRAEMTGWGSSLLFSLVMPVLHPSPDYLWTAIDSVKTQAYGFWELCIAVDQAIGQSVLEQLQRYASADSRIKVVLRDTDGQTSVAGVVALELVQGSYVAFLDQHDLLHPLALYHVARELRNHPDTDFVYSDEDLFDDQRGRYEPHFKPDFNYDLLLSYHYFRHLTVIARALIEKTDRLRDGYNDAEEYDLVLRCLEQARNVRVRHIPRVLYHRRRIHEKSPVVHRCGINADDLFRNVVKDHLKRRGIACEVEVAPESTACNRIRYLIAEPVPTVDIIILTRDRAELLATCVDSIISRTNYENYTITIVDNGSVKAKTHELFKRLKSEPRVRIVRNDTPFNFSRLNNRAVDRSGAEFVCLLNNDTEVINAAWLEEMVGHAQQSEVGAVGARLWYPDQTLQHGGIILGVGGIANHAHLRLPMGWSGYFARAVVQQSVSAVTGACLLVRKRYYAEVGGLDEEHLGVAYNDVDFCLKLRERGYRNVWTPYAELYHHESASRGDDKTRRNKARLNVEAEYMQQHWGKIIADDPAYSPNLTYDRLDFSYAWPPRARG